MSRFFIPPECIKGNIALIVGPEAHHILAVLRLKKGDKIEAFAGSGKLYQGKILDTGNKKVKVQIEHIRQDLPRSNLEITLVQALPKKSKMDYIIEKCTELGIDAIIPAQTARTIVKLDQARQISRQVRWQRIAQEAAKQCGRTTIPRVKDLTPWPEVLSALCDFDLKLLFSLGAKTEQLKDVLRAQLEKSFLTGRAQNEAKRVALLIGPEGDFTPEEIHQAFAAGCLATSLGTGVLKSDTAAVSALAIVNYELKT